ncbi:MAG: PEGA domain-containing protein, partial [Anaeromyxobacteraceae bacterium]
GTSTAPPPAPAAAPVPPRPDAPATQGGAPESGAPPVRGAPIYGIQLPRPASGEGILAVNASPWATLFVDGRRLGDTPREVRLPAGSHRVRVVHPRLGAVEGAVEIVAGRRTAWYPRLGR